MVKRKGRRGQKRKSARIKALEALKKAKKENKNNNSASSTEEVEQNPEISNSCDQHNVAQSPTLAAAEGMEASSSRQSLPEEPRRGRKKKKKLDEVSVGPTTHQNGAEANLAVPPVNSVLPSKQRMLEKSILEFILDILQRRDTHEIFAQPVDQNEVEGYYSVIEEPMDFGTMRAKLQEGIYTTLEQFENDVFLITNNAMLFNSSTTIYFRQARAIHELAKRVFHTLKTEPRKIELEFSLTRKRYGKKPRGEYGGSRAKQRVNNLAYCGSAGGNPHDNDIPPGCGYGKNVSSYKTERRQTYTRQYSAVNEEESIDATVYSSSNQLVPGNGGIGYKESLLQFVRDLGPIAQKVARQKLRCLTQTPIPLTSSTASQPGSTCLNGVTINVTPAVNNLQGTHGTTSKGKNILISDITGIDSCISGGRMEVGIDGLDIPISVSKGKVVLSGDGINSYRGTICRETHPCSVNDGSDKYMDLGQEALRGDSGNCNQNIRSQLCSYLPNDQVQPSHSASTPPQPALFEFLSSSNRRTKSSVYSSTLITPSRSSQSTALMHGPGRESNDPLNLNGSSASLSLVSQPVEWCLPTPWGPQAIVNHYANLWGNNGFMQQEPQQLPVVQYLQAKSSNGSPLVASAAPCAQVQSIGMNPLGQDAVIQQELLSQYGYTQPQPSLLNFLGQGIFTQPNPLSQDACVLHGPQLVVPAQYMQPLTNYVNPVDWNRFLSHSIESQETQPRLPHQGVMSDPMYFNDQREHTKDHQHNSNAEFRYFQQQFLRGTTSQHPDLERLRSKDPY